MYHKHFKVKDGREISEIVYPIFLFLARLKWQPCEHKNGSSLKVNKTERNLKKPIGEREDQNLILSFFFDRI